MSGLIPRAPVACFSPWTRSLYMRLVQTPAALPPRLNARTERALTMPAAFVSKSTSCGGMSLWVARAICLLQAWPATATANAGELRTDPGFVLRGSVCRERARLALELVQRGNVTQVQDAGPGSVFQTVQIQQVTVRAAVPMAFAFPALQRGVIQTAPAFRRVLEMAAYATVIADQVRDDPGGVFGGSVCRSWRCLALVPRMTVRKAHTAKPIGGTSEFATPDVTSVGENVGMKHPIIYVGPPMPSRRGGGSGRQNAPRLPPPKKKHEGTRGCS